MLTLAVVKALVDRKEMTHLWRALSYAVTVVILAPSLTADYTEGISRCATARCSTLLTSKSCAAGTNKTGFL